MRVKSVISYSVASHFSSSSSELWSLHFSKPFYLVFSLSLPPFPSFFLGKTKSEQPNSNTTLWEVWEMRIISCHGYSLRLLSSLCVASIFVVMILSSHFCELMRTFYANSKSSEYSVPLLELQQKLTTTHDHVTPLRSDSTTTTTAFNLNRTVPVRYNLSLSHTHIDSVFEFVKPKGQNR